jgi:hypothetical protein
MPRKQATPEVEPELFTKTDLDDLTQMSLAIAKTHLRKIEFQLIRNLSERSALERMKFHIDAAIANAVLANRAHTERWVA